MPAGDGTGPCGMGPMTGRGMGYCAGYAAPGYATPWPGPGFGRGFGRGLGLGFRGGRGWGAANRAPAAYGPPPVGAAASKRQQIDALQGQAQYLEETLAEIKQRLAELESDGADT